MTQPTLARSWVASANGHADFPLQNLPLGIFSLNDAAPRSGVAIGDCILDLHAALDAFDGEARRAVQATAGGQLNGLFALGRGPRVALRERLLELLAEGSPLQVREAQVLHRAADCQLHLPAKIGDYTDFYVGIEHAQNVGKLFRPDNPLLPNYKYVPIGYHGRASTVRPSGVEVRRPKGQTLPAGQTEPTFGPCARLDYELELGIWIGQGNTMGEAIAIGDAAEHIAGFCLLNDWSARDIQAWEYQPLGPFLSKSFITHRLAVGGHGRSAGAVPQGSTATSRRRSATAAVLAGSTRPGRRCSGYRTGSAAQHRRHARAKPAGPSPGPEQQPAYVLDRRAVGGPPQRQRLPAAARRSVRFRHLVRARSGPARQPAGDHRRR
ncbi:2-keto-4-pentenoate hydratase/2-oxohepta-3-ene-1,7-dioic acid hydratase in catechol pathway [Pseudomonas rhodesiae]|nr:2-keto-4-pentenoate hydratase/2-oxohepta-3-ene-1,7-dioic acid hydratase in catechol pathway [Pseudomonas rhodesiae]